MFSPVSLEFVKFLREFCRTICVRAGQPEASSQQVEISSFLQEFLNFFSNFLEFWTISRRNLVDFYPNFPAVMKSDSAIKHATNAEWKSFNAVSSGIWQ